MRMKVRTSNLERISVGLALALTVAGVLMGSYCDPTYLNRFGSLIIIVGVVITAIKLSDIIDKQFEVVVSKHHNEQMDLLFDAYKSFWGGDLTGAFKDQLRKNVELNIANAVADYKKRRIDRLKKVEISVVVFGTFVNGFGDLLINRSAALLALW